MIISIHNRYIKISVEVDDDANIETVFNAIRSILRGAGYSDESIDRYLIDES